MGRPQAIDCALRRLAFGSIRRDLEHLLPRLFSAGQFLLPERPDEAKVQPRLRVFRIDLRRTLQLLRRAIGLVRV
jgi:hypothetical protein